MAIPGKQIGSVMSLIPLIADLEGKFDIEFGMTWLSDNLVTAWCICAVYLVVIYGGRSLMKTRAPYSLKRTLLVWNVGLAAFSVMGTAVSMPVLLYSIYHNGLTYSVCNSNYMTDPHIGLWSILFVISKPVELGDTIFIVLRKSPLSFLHWYHHITVLLYCWYGASQGGTVGHWFGGMNYTVHSVMYTYYAFKAAGVRVPSFIARIVTTLQISQMFVGLMVSMIAMNAKMNDIYCHSTYRVLYVGFGIYASYFVLFLNFYYHRYCQRSKVD